MSLSQQVNPYSFCLSMLFLFVSTCRPVRSHADEVELDAFPFVEHFKVHILRPQLSAMKQRRPPAHVFHESPAQPSWFEGHPDVTPAGVDVPSGIDDVALRVDQERMFEPAIGMD